MNIFNIILGFMEGLALIISPCILPILPIMLAGSITGSKQRPMGITAGFVVTFTLFAYFSRQWVQYTGIDLNWVRYIAYIMLFILGCILLSSWLTEKFEYIAQRLIKTNAYFNKRNHPQEDFFNGFILGGLVSIVWTPCAGPILAAVIVQTVLQQSTVVSFFILLAFALGAALPMLLIAMYGKQLINRFGFLKSKSVLFRKILGVMLMASVVYMMYQEHANTTPATVRSAIKIATRLQNGLWRPYLAPAISGIDTWINTQPLQLSALKGHVVLIDFWTYSCINCIRTLPYLNYFDKHYRHKGLIIIGVHTPEFDFEKNPQNVKKAVQRNSIQYPVALDNQFATWQQFKNHYWPAHYLINKQGQVVYTHFGEGDNDVLENNIRFLLGIDSLAMSHLVSNTRYAFSETPETYLGYARRDKSASPELIRNKAALYTFSENLPANAWSLQGAWEIRPDKIIAKQVNASIKIRFHARRVYLVMGSARRPIHVDVLLNGKKLLTNQGRDVHNGRVFVDKQSIYELMALPQAATGVLQITTDAPDLALYTFTFGS